MPQAKKPRKPAKLTVAVTGPTGTFGHGLIPLLQRDERVGKVVGIARRPFDPAEQGWSKMEYRQGDVRDPEALQQAFQGADVVVHLAFMITGTATREAIREINVDGTLNVFRAAAAAGAKRFVYASSVAAYGFHEDNPVPLTEDWPTRPAAHLFYAQEKAELEERLAEEDDRHPDLDLYLLRPSIVVGPNAVGGKEILPKPLDEVAGRLAGLIGRSPVPVPFLAPDLPMQLVHEADVGSALLQCIVAAGPPGAYNIAGDGVLTGADMAREAGLAPITLPGKPVQAVAKLLAAVPGTRLTPPAAGWVEALSHPAIMATDKAKRDLDWTPRYTGLEALRDTLDRGPREP